jgi:hypothetical protein
MGSHSETYYAHEFTALGVGGIVENKGIIDAALAAISPPLSVPVNKTDIALGGAALIVEWATLPTQEDVDDVAELVPTIVGVATTSAPLSFSSPGVTTAPNATLVTKIDSTSPPLAAGTYAVTYQDQHRLQTAAAGDSAGVRITITVSGFPPFFQEDEWPFVLKHANNYAVPIVIGAGQTIQVQSQVYKLGAGAAIAEVSKARFTIDKIG